jgi:elongation factor 1 alpha-like protein
MSRHRDIRNLSEDDYYDYEDDYYDDDYDDYYYDDDNNNESDNYHESKMSSNNHKNKTSYVIQSENKVGIIKTSFPEKKQVNFSIKPKVKSNQKKATITTKSSAKVVEKGPTEQEKKEKERLVTSMGFNVQDARSALMEHQWDPQRAIHHLLSSNKTGMMAPPIMESSSTINTASTINTTTIPPNQPKTNNVTSTQKDHPSIQSKKDTKKKQINTTVAPNASLSSSFPKKKMSLELQEKLKAQKSRLTMVILGHVDHGKSTLMGQVLVQTGVVDKRIVSKYEKQAGEIGKSSFALAWIMDEDESERERGVTIDIATKSISTQSHDITILDAPGHADYVPAMITGAGVSDVGILVVSSARGEFESGFDSAVGSNRPTGQTREHITLARGLGVSQLIVAVNKLDASEPSWSQVRFEEIKARLEPFLQLNGFNMNRVQFVPISGLTGVNIKINASADERAVDLAKWYKGQTLLEAIDSFQPAKRNIEKPFRFIISDLYQEGKGIIAKGRVVQGMISVGDKVSILPIGDIATVNRVDRAVGNTDDDEVDAERMKVALAGESIDLFLVGIDIARVTVGNIISDANLSLRPAIQKKFLAKILIMDDITVPIIRGSQFLLHMHTLDVPATINSINSKTGKDGVEISRPRVLVGGSSASVEIKLSEKLCLETYAECKALGRFVLRRGGDTVAVGIIESLLKSEK